MEKDFFFVTLPLYNKETMKTKMIGLVAFISSLLGCNAQNQGFTSLSVGDYAKAIEDTTIVRLDVRSAAEYAAGHIANAINIDVLQDGFETKAMQMLPKNKTVAVNCRSGKRSKRAAAILVKRGYEVIELDAGFNEWVNAGMPVTK